MACLGQKHGSSESSNVCSTLTDCSIFTVLDISLNGGHDAKSDDDMAGSGHHLFSNTLAEHTDVSRKR